MPSSRTSPTAWLPSRTPGESGVDYIERIFALRIGAAAAAELDDTPASDATDPDADDPFGRLWRDPAAFRDVVLVDTDEGPRVLGQVMDDWQLADYTALDPAWRKLAGTATNRAAVLNAWLERPKGHSKTTDIAVMVAWILSASPRIVWGLCAANDKDQAALVRKALVKLKADNPWLPIEVRNWQVTNPEVGSTLDIIASDVAGSHGQIPDFVICDEVTHWKDSELYDSLRAGSAKRANAIFVVITNAGVGRDWHWKKREIARTSPDRWHFSRLEGPTATWLDPAKLVDQRKELPDKTFRRLWLNEWQHGTGDGIADADIEACRILPGPARGPEQGWRYIMAVDLGLRSDHAAAVVLGIRHPSRPEPGQLPDPPRFRLARVLEWRPADYGGEVPLPLVERDIELARDRFGIEAIYGDESQFALMAQRLQTRVHTVMVAFGSARVQRGLGPSLLKAFRHRHIETYQHDALEYDLRSISVVENPQSRTWKVTAPADAEHGHADRGIALAIALLFGYDWTPIGLDEAETTFDTVDI